MPQNLRTRGRSGLVVSPLALGTMTFGTPRWGSPDAVSAAIFDAYVDAGGNFIDTADVYAGGRSEELLGGFIADRKLRDRPVLATKFSFHGGEAGNPNGGGNGRKNLHRALHGSLRRLRTDCIDLYWLHVWDGVTPAEELLQSLGACRALGRARVGPAKGLSLGAKRSHTVWYGEHLQRRISSFAGTTLRAGAIFGARRRCQLVVWLGHTPHRRLAWHRNSPRRGPDPKPDRLLGACRCWTWPAASSRPRASMSR